MDTLASKTGQDRRSRASAVKGGQEAIGIRYKMVLPACGQCHLDQRRSALADQRLHFFSRERAQAMLDESGVQRAREIIGRINQSAVEIEKKRLRH